MLFINLLAFLFFLKKIRNVGYFEIELLFTDLELGRNKNLIFRILLFGLKLFFFINI